MIKKTESATSRKTKELKIIPLGGLNEVGRNMMLFEYDNDIIIVDMGLQFPEEDMPGIDYIIPNTAYLKDKKENIRGVIITHGHYDHIGAIPHSMARLGNPTIYTAALTRGMILKRQEDFPHAPKLNINTIDRNDKIKLGCFDIEFFHVNHNIPDSLGVVIKSPVGTIVHTGDFKFDHSPINEDPADIAKITQIGSQGVQLLMSDSTDSETPGHSLSEKEIRDNLSEIIKNCKGRLIAATFASLLTRVQSLVHLAELNDRKVVIEGYSMKSNVSVARELGYLKAKESTFISAKEANKLPDDKVMIICTGAQGEGNAVLMRLANGGHKTLEVHEGDTIMFSSSVVPGNERSVQNLRDALCRKGAKIIHYAMMDVHAGGHAPIEDLKMMLNLIKPKFFIPIEGNYYMRELHGEIAESVGMSKDNILLGENGDVFLLDKESLKLSNQKVPASYVMVDGLGVGDVGQVVLSDRQAMARDGMFVIIATVDSKTGRVRGEPDIISRGFIYLRENKELLDKTREKVKTIVKDASADNQSMNLTHVKNNIRDKVGQFLYTKTQRRPMVLPVIIRV